VTWRGSVEVTGEGKDIRLGMTVVPERATFKATGEKGAPDVVVRFEVRDGRPEMVEVSVKTKADGRGIRSTDMEVFNETLIKNVYAFIGTQLAPDPNSATASGTWPATDDDMWAIQGAVEKARQRRGTVNLEELKKVAEVYRAHTGRAPTNAVAEFLDYTPRTAARRVQQARDAELLPPIEKGESK
jgi:hypothetical protein